MQQESVTSAQPAAIVVTATVATAVAAAVAAAPAAVAGSQRQRRGYHHFSEEAPLSCASACPCGVIPYNLRMHMHPSQGTAQGHQAAGNRRRQEPYQHPLGVCRQHPKWEHDLAAPSEVVLVQAHGCPESPVHCGTTAYECPPLYGW